MHPVVITWGKVCGNKAAIAEQGGHVVVTRQQCFQGVVMAFSLQQLNDIESTTLADGTIGRHNQRIRFSIQAARIFT